LFPEAPLLEVADGEAVEATTGCAAALARPVALLEPAPESLVAAPVVCGLAVSLVLESPSAVERFWLISINCSRLFTETNWLMYSLGSVSAVGSWFCISVTSRVRKSLAEIVAEESPASLESLLLLVPVLELAAGAAIAAACAAVSE
jgi:hypothetical protein